MRVFASFNEQLDDLLTRICAKVQVSKSEHDRAKTSYEHVSAWLASAPEGSVLFHSNPQIYPQGSLRIGTALKPIGKNEFDVDLVCEFQLPWANLTPEVLLEATFTRLRENETFKRMLPDRLEPGKRCVTLTYKNEFHIDVLPACPKTLGIKTGDIKVADKLQRGKWKDSNPKGYAKWFDERSDAFPLQLREALAKAIVDDFPDHEDFEVKTPLQRSSQLLKRWRDISFYNSKNPDVTPISVVITTLAAMSYEGQASINETVHGLLLDLHSKITAGQKIRVPNPTNKEEDFAERWSHIPGARETFSEWTIATYSRWSELNKARGPALAKALKEMFGEEVAEHAIRSQVQLIEKSRSRDQLGINTNSGLLTGVSAVSALPVKKNTFFGGK